MTDRKIPEWTTDTMPVRFGFIWLMILGLTQITIRNPNLNSMQAYAEERTSRCYDPLSLACYTLKKEPDLHLSSGDPVDVEDLYVNPDRYLNKQIYVKNFQCYSASSDEYRCFAGEDGPVTIFSASVEDDLEKDRLDKFCAKARDAETYECTRAFSFTPLKTTSDEVSGVRRTIILTLKISIIQ